MKNIKALRFGLRTERLLNKALAADFIKNAYYNGLGRHVCQLQRVTLKFCKNSFSSRGVREFIEIDLMDWARRNPGVVVYVKPRRHRTAVITTEYLNGQSHWMSAKDFTRTEMNWWLEFLRTRSGYEISQLLSPNNVSWPSVQGPWTPFLNRPTHLNVSQFPNQERSEYKPLQPSATEQLLELAKGVDNISISDNDSKDKN